MSTENANQPAFPTDVVSRGYDGEAIDISTTASVGLTKREYIAAMAMQGLLASDNQFDDAEETAKLCINFADALLRQLSS